MYMHSPIWLSDIKKLFYFSKVQLHFDENCCLCCLLRCWNPEYSSLSLWSAVHGLLHSKHRTEPWSVVRCTVSCSPGEPLHPADCCPPVMDSHMDWLMPTPSLHCRQATAGVEWRWFEPAVQPQLQLWGVWPGSLVVCLLHGPPYYAKSQTQHPMKCWTAGLSSGSQVCYLFPHTLHILFILRLIYASLNCGVDVQ